MKYGVLALDYDGAIARDGELDPYVKSAIAEARTQGNCGPAGHWPHSRGPETGRRGNRICWVRFTVSTDPERKYRRELSRIGGDGG